MKSIVIIFAVLSCLFMATPASAQDFPSVGKLSKTQMLKMDLKFKVQETKKNFRRVAHLLKEDKPLNDYRLAILKKVKLSSRYDSTSKNIITARIKKLVADSTEIKTVTEAKEIVISYYLSRHYEYSGKNELTRVFPKFSRKKIDSVFIKNRETIIERVRTVNVYISTEFRSIANVTKTPYVEYDVTKSYIALIHELFHIAHGLKYQKNNENEKQDMIFTSVKIEEMNLDTTKTEAFDAFTGKFSFVLNTSNYPASIALSPFNRKSFSSQVDSLGRVRDSYYELETELYARKAIFLLLFKKSGIKDLDNPSTLEFTLEDYQKFNDYIHNTWIPDARYKDAIEFFILTKKEYCIWLINNVP